MAKKPKAPSFPYDEEQTVAVTFSRVVRRGAIKYLPRDNPVMTGATLNAIVEENGGADVVRSVEPR
ncbi:hypothetical protein [Devosia sp. FJ2-5-3]|uniref:hypothetical protein n=1 Tax=Devosia sp. FJ2-5-3 TaxID=2976680 RepID=UPI0023D82BA4|nr:hypothetical protein [Devosia sp. FJ2-5-3]WEJ60241.1 hypothetical protein N0P34_09465 [Devosia sp. FJ2-5-3]